MSRLSVSQALIKWENVGGTHCKIPFVDKTSLTHTHMPNKSNRDEVLQRYTICGEIIKNFRWYGSRQFSNLFLQSFHQIWMDLCNIQIKLFVTIILILIQWFNNNFFQLLLIVLLVQNETETPFAAALCFHVILTVFTSRTTTAAASSALIYYQYIMYIGKILETQ